MRAIALLVHCAALPLTLSAFDTNFSGSWKLDPNRSHDRGVPAKAPARMEIKSECESSDCRLEVRENDGTIVWHVTTDRAESRDKAGEHTISSKSKWEGSALLINSIISNPQKSVTRMDRWKLSRDGKTLTIRRQIVTLYGEIESILVYEQ